MNLNQLMAQFIQNEIALLSKMARTDELIARDRERFEERFDRIERRLAVIEEILRDLPQALRREIGFKPQ